MLSEDTFAAGTDERTTMNRGTGQPGYRDRFFVDAEGYLWTVPYGATDGETRTLDVFDPEGRYLGEPRADFSIGLERTAMASVLRGTPVIVRGNHLYAVSFDDLDVPYVVRARVIGR